METPYSRIKEVKEVKEAPTPEAANELLKQGFILVKVLENYTNTPERQFSNIVYVLGRQGSNGGYDAPPAQSGHVNTQSEAPAINPTILENRPWKK